MHGAVLFFATFLYRHYALISLTSCLSWQHLKVVNNNLTSATCCRSVVPWLCVHRENAFYRISRGTDENLLCNVAGKVEQVVAV